MRFMKTYERYKNPKYKRSIDENMVDGKNRNVAQDDIGDLGISSQVDHRRQGAQRGAGDVRIQKIRDAGKTDPGAFERGGQIEFAGNVGGHRLDVFAGEPPDRVIEGDAVAIREAHGERTVGMVYQKICSDAAHEARA